jgi:hypothetical protein
MKDEDRLNLLVGIIDRGISNGDKSRTIANECLDLSEHWHIVRISRSNIAHYHTICKGEVSEYGKDAAIVLCDRPEPVRPNELLYDYKENPVAIKTNGKILPIIEGDL